MPSATFKIHKRELLSVLKKFKKSGRSSKRRDSTLEVTIINAGLRLNIPGIEIPIAATPIGTYSYKQT